MFALCTIGTCRTCRTCRTLRAFNPIHRVLRHRRRGDRLTRQHRAVHGYFEIALLASKGSRKEQVDGENPVHDRIVEFTDHRADLAAAAQ